ncbi:Alkaline phosphatase precursor [Pelotomaculum schinkii]|uniref:Alkaline phosphatase n=1 Tax=Pelotomaculum schinkii TaxID=78350 RepID=A0A4Y7RG81_9FIRM|nr:metallophosphoesterase family protein [Pelotomaculum schinkii]TEB08018.1 Alkaline phosphatase precursor [Pelotomaculum schinkii]
MLKMRDRLKWMGLLLVLMLLAGAAFIGQGAAGNTDPPEQTVGQEVYGSTGLQAPAVQTFVYGAAGAPEQVILSWTGDPRTTQTIAWRTGDAVTGGKIQYMKESEKTGDFSGALEKEAVSSELYTGFNHFEAQLDSLESGVTYVYRVGCEGGWSEAGAFTTAADTDKFSFMYMGDLHIGYDPNSAGVWKQLLENALTNYPDLKFALQGGDLVDETTDTGQWEEFFNTAAGVFDRIPFMPAIGNHEFENASSIYLKSFALPQNGPEELKEHHYSFDYGNAHFVVLDSNLMGSEGDLSEAGMNWLESDLQSSDKTWKFVMFHHPPYGVDSRDATLSDMIKASWAPIMESNGVDMVFVGHQHLYMRTYPISAGVIQERPDQGITYVLGNAGNKTYLQTETHDYIAVVKESSASTGYTAINIDGDVLTMTTRGLDGGIMDEFEISKSSDMDSRVAVDSVKLVNSDYQEISAASGSGYCHLKARINNYTSKAQTADVLFQVRSGSGATAEYGGEPLGIVSLQSEIPATGADVYADIILSDVSPGKAYADVYVLDDAGVPINVPFEYSFDITS